MQRFFCHCLFLVSPSFGASGSLYFVIAAFPGFIHLCLFIINSFRAKIIGFEKNASLKTKGHSHVRSHTRLFEVTYAKIYNLARRK